MHSHLPLLHVLRKGNSDDKFHLCSPVKIWSTTTSLELGIAARIGSHCPCFCYHARLPTTRTLSELITVRSSVLRYLAFWLANVQFYCLHELYCTAKGTGNQAWRGQYLKSASSLSQCPVCQARRLAAGSVLLARAIFKTGSLKRSVISSKVCATSMPLSALVPVLEPVVSAAKVPERLLVHC